MAFRIHTALSQKPSPCLCLPPAHPMALFSKNVKTIPSSHRLPPLPGAVGSRCTPWRGGPLPAPIPSSSLDNRSLANGRRDRHCSPASPASSRPFPHGAGCAHGPCSPPTPLPAPSAPPGPCTPRTWGMVIRGAWAHHGQEAQEEQRLGRRPGPPQAGESAHGALGSPSVLARAGPLAAVGARSTCTHSPVAQRPTPVPRTGSARKGGVGGARAGALPSALPSSPGGLSPRPPPPPLTVQGLHPLCYSQPAASARMCGGHCPAQPRPPPPCGIWQVWEGERTCSRCGAGDVRPTSWGRG